jgi:hypothetical protein
METEVSTPPWQTIATIIGIPIITILLQEFMKRNSEREKTRFEWLHKEKTDALKELNDLIHELNELRKKYLFDEYNLESKEEEDDNGCCRRFSESELEEMRKSSFQTKEKINQKLRVFYSLIERKQFLFRPVLNKTLAVCRKSYQDTFKHVNLDVCENVHGLGESESTNLIFDENEKILELVGKELRVEYGTNEGRIQSWLCGIKNKINQAMQRNKKWRNR